MLVDLPGYGYAAAPNSDISGWTRLIQHYLRGRATLAPASLVDSRHGYQTAGPRAHVVLDPPAHIRRC